MAARTLTLANGKAVTVLPGDFLPDDLPDDFELVLIPDVIEVKTIFVKTWKHTLADTVVAFREGAANQTVVDNCFKCINKMLPHWWFVFSKVQEGHPVAAESWEDFCSDIAIVTAHKMYLGNPIRVMLELPELQEDGKSLHGTYYMLKM
jgi:hypothetical protein